MAKSFKLPDLGEGIHEGEVLAVLVSVGDPVKEGDPILEVETDKAAVEIPSPFTATVSEILVKPGDVVKVDDVLLKFENGEGKKSVTEVKTPEKEAEEISPSSAPAIKRDKRPVPASPATRRLARELGVDLHEVPPTGSAGLVTADDIRAYTAKGTPPAPAEVPAQREISVEARPLSTDAPPLPDFEKWGPVERVPIRSIRRATAKQMAISWSQIPHVTSQAEIDITKLEEFRKKHKADVETKGGKLTLTVFALKAVVTALKMYPNFNATLDAAAGEIVYKKYYHIGVAVDTQEGLIVPVIRDVDQKSITDLAIELNDLVQRTHQRKTSLKELQGSTFTISNVGHMGGGHFSPIINYPEVAIMGMGAARMKPVVIEKREGTYDIVPRLILPVVITIDHRVLDGGDAHRFLKVVMDALNDPDVLMMTMV